MPLNGDGLSVERHVNVRRNRSNSDIIPDGRLLGLEPVPQEFHKRGIYLQVYCTNETIFII
jgi:hypothetical protein